MRVSWIPNAVVIGYREAVALLAQQNYQSGLARQAQDLQRLASGGLPTQAIERLKEIGENDNAIFTSDLAPEEVVKGFLSDDGGLRGHQHPLRRILRHGPEGPEEARRSDEWIDSGERTDRFGQILHPGGVDSGNQSDRDTPHSDHRKPY